jgi:NADP-reducing hydrogenase subunit HndB
MNALLDDIQKKNIKDIILTTSGCAGLCSKEPMATVEIKGEAPVKYIELTPEKIRDIVSQHVLNGEIVKSNALAVGSERTG